MEYLSFNSRPHKEVDNAVLTGIKDGFAFQLTTSQGGRPYSIYPFEMFIVFQLTTSQGGRHRAEIRILFTSVFQLTTSQGGRPQALQLLPDHLSFNSRPHKEVDPP